MNNYQKMSTDGLLNFLPDHLHLARNSNAEESDRWRLYNHFTGQYTTLNDSTPRALILNYLNHTKGSGDLHHES